MSHSMHIQEILLRHFYNGSWSPTNAQSGTWSTCYSGISNCNLFLDKYVGLTFPELEQNADYKPQMFRYNNYQYEVRFLRAYFTLIWCVSMEMCRSSIIS